MGLEGSDNNLDEEKRGTILKLKNEFQKSKTIFSDKEIHETVKSFILAYMHGKVKIKFPSVASINKNRKLKGEKINDKIAFERAIVHKTEFVCLISICSGVDPSTPDELEDAKHKLFEKIMIYKISERLKGSFLDFEGGKIDELETKLEATNNLVEKLLNTLMDEASNSNDKLS